MNLWVSGRVRDNPHGSHCVQDDVDCMVKVRASNSSRLGETKIREVRASNASRLGETKIRECKRQPDPMAKRNVLYRASEKHERKTLVS